ncbi:MAG TPA: hypothetical protein VGM23_06350, partial [Armatimonadota bacterium]
MYNGINGSTGTDWGGGSETSKNFSLTLVPAASAGATGKRVGLLCFQGTSFEGNKSTVTVNSIDYGAQTRTFTKPCKIDLQTWQNSEVGIRGFLVPVKTNENVTFNINVTR